MLLPFLVKRCLHSSLVAHQTCRFGSTRWPRVFPLPHAWDCNIIPGIRFDRGISKTIRLGEVLWEQWNWPGFERGLLHPRSHYLKDLHYLQKNSLLLWVVRFMFSHLRVVSVWPCSIGQGCFEANKFKTTLHRLLISRVFIFYKLIPMKLNLERELFKTLQS